MSWLRLLGSKDRSRLNVTPAEKFAFIDWPYANRPVVCVQSNINTARRVRIMILAHLHLGVDHACVLTLPVDVVHLGEVILLAKGGIEDVVEVNW